MFHARAWTAQEVEVLLDIWQDPIIRETLASARDPLDGCTQISDTMGDSGYVVRLKSRSHIPMRLNSPGVHSQRCFADLHKQPGLVPASVSVHNTVDEERKVTYGLLCDLLRA